MKNIIKTIVNLAIGLGGLGVILHLKYKNEELEQKRASAEASEKFWKNAFKSETGLRIEHEFDVLDWKLLYKKYGWGGNPSIWDKWTTERLMGDKKDDEIEDLTEE